MIKDVGFHPIGSSFDNERIRLLPFGLQISADGMNPVLLLRDEKGEMTLPVLVNHLEAGVALTQSNKNIAPVSPHKVTEILLENLNLKFESCEFCEVKGMHQYVRLNLSGHPNVKFINVRADEAMSLCLHLNIPMYATRSYISKAKVLNSEVAISSQVIKGNPEVLARPHKYMM